jgi:hypothetical protein
MFTSYYKHLWDQNLENELKRVHPNAKITKTEYINPYSYMVGPIRVQLEYEIPGYATVTDEEIIVKSFAASGIFKRGMSHLYINTGVKEREYPFRDRCSRYVKFNENIKLPGPSEIVYAPVEETFQDSTAYFEGGFIISKSGNTLRMTLNAAFEKRIYQAEEWPSFRQVVLSQKAFMDEPIILKRLQSQNQ